jgi:hypothetical protein
MSVHSINLILLLGQVPRLHLVATSLNLSEVYDLRPAVQLCFELLSAHVLVKNELRLQLLLLLLNEISENSGHACVHPVNSFTTPGLLGLKLD